jgi:hypothetical protein
VLLSGLLIKMIKKRKMMMNEKDYIFKYSIKINYNHY